jgi:hypothetical protein
MDRMGHEPSELADMGGTGATGEDRLPDRVAGLVGEVTGDERPPSTRRLAALLQDAARGSARSVGRGVRATRRATSHGAGRSGRWLAGQVLVMAPRLPIRDQATLREQFAGRSPEEVADALIEGSARASAAVGAAVGAWAVLPVVPAIPVEVATETLALVGIEIKLVAELHEVYGMRAPGGVAERMFTYVAAWANRGGVALAPGGLIIAIGSPLHRRLQRRLAFRAGRSAFSLLPLFTGAAAGALFNRTETRRLGREIRDDLRRRSPIAAHWSASQVQQPE